MDKIYISGKGASGKSTYANIFKQKGYYVVHLDDVIKDKIFVLFKNHIENNTISFCDLFKIYRNDVKSNILNEIKIKFIEIIKEYIKKYDKCVIEGTIKDVQMIKDIFDGFEFKFYYVIPKNIESYTRNITSRFIKEPNDYGRLGFIQSEDSNKNALNDFNENGINGMIISKLLKKVGDEQYKKIKELYDFYNKDFVVEIFVNEYK
jgi:dephospho-CoA kinase